MKTIVALFILGLLLVSFVRPGEVKPEYRSLSDSVFVVGDIIELPPIWFDLAKCTLRPDKDSVMEQTDSLMRIVKLMNDHPQLVLVVRNHTDTVNPYLSQRLTYCRAKSILDRLIELGADKNRLSAEGMGDTEPLTLQHTLHLPSGDSLVAGAVLTHRFIATRKSKKADWELMRQKNRRCDLKVVRVDYVAPVDTLKH